MNSQLCFPAEGGCTCSEVRYRLTREPMFVHCCHCTWCQRETGSAFALNALVEAEAVELVRGSPQTIDTPSNSGKGQQITRCPRCQVALWSHYSAAGAAVSFVRVGTLDDAHRIAPDIHIFTSTKMPWLRLDKTIPAVADYYRRSEYWAVQSLERYRRAVVR